MLEIRRLRGQLTTAGDGAGQELLSLPSFGGWHIHRADIFFFFLLNLPSPRFPRSELRVHGCRALR